MQALALSYPKVSNIVPILATFLSLSRSFSKSYCWPCQARIVDLSLRFYQLSLSRRTLNRYLGALEAGGFIRRIRRHKRVPGEGMRFASTIYILLKPAYVLLSRFGSSLFSAGVRITERLRARFSKAPKSLVVDRAACLSPARVDFRSEVRKFLMPAP